MSFLNGIPASVRAESSQQIVTTTSTTTPTWSCSWPQSLPLEIYREIKEWLHEEDYFRFLNTSQKYTQVKFMTRRIILSRKDVEEFVENEVFRERILSRIANPYSQLTLHTCFLQSHLPVLKDINCSLWNRNESLEPQEWYTLLEGRESILCSSKQPFPENTIISNVKKLTLCCSLPAAVTNISALTLYYCDLKDGFPFLQSCGQLAELTVQYCTGVKSLKGLDMIASSLSILTLNSLDALRDISTLSELTLKKCEVRNCFRIEDYTPLTSSGTPSIVMQPVGMRTLNYSNFHPSTRSFSLRDHSLGSFPVSSFSSLHFLQLFGFDHLASLSNALHHIPFLEIIQCALLSDISMLGGHQCVKIRSCGQITDFSSLKNVRAVSISACSGFIRGSDLENVQHLIIEDCRYFVDPSALGNVYHLEFARLSLQSLVGLHSVPVISLCDLKLQDGFKGLGGNRRVTLIRRENNAEDFEEILHLFPGDRYNCEYLDDVLIIYAKN